MNEARYTHSGGTAERAVRMRSATCSGDSIMVMRTSITPIATSLSAGSDLSASRSTMSRLAKSGTNWSMGKS
jgi:hypothetical protein